MFKELNDNLTSIESEVGKLKIAIEHIDQAKEVAEKTVVVAETLTKEFSIYLKGVTQEVDKILKPHKELIEATKKLKIFLIVSIGMNVVTIGVFILTIILRP